MRRDLFKRGKRYRSRLDFMSGPYAFFKGETLTFDQARYSPYDGCTFHEFIAADGAGKAWLLSDNDSPESWRAYFRPVGLFG